MQGLLAMKDMYCYVGDLLGFKNTIMNLGKEEQKTRVSEWTKFIDESIKRFDNITNYQLISDTIFISAESNKNGLENLLNLSKYLLEEGLKKSFLLRGAITFGEVDWDDPRIAFGKSIVEAYNLGITKIGLELVAEKCFLTLIQCGILIKYSFILSL